MRKMMAVITALLMSAVFVGIGAPANATVLAHKSVNCTYDGANNPAGGDITVETYGDGRFLVTGTIIDGHNRNWDWWMYHEGGVSAKGGVSGTATIERTMVDAPGEDGIRWKFQNYGNTVTCSAKVFI